MDWITAEVDRIHARLVDRLRPRLSKNRRQRFEAQLHPELETLFRQFHELYGWRWDFSLQLLSLLETMADAYANRKKRHLKRADRGHDWIHDPATTWAMAYVDRLAGDFVSVERLIPHLERLGITHLHLMPPWRTPKGPDDGGYAVSDYRSTRPDLGTITDLRHLIDRLAEHGIEVVLDVVANHTADDHRWAKAAKRGLLPERDYYHFFPDRSEPDRIVEHLREIFPDRGGDAFTWRSDVESPDGGAWVWTTFYPFQWDLDYGNPEVAVAMAGELLSIANLGAGVVRVDATPFLWKEPGTTCENLPQAHTVVALLATVLRVVAPEVLLLSEAIVHPDDVTRFVRPEECRLGYNPLVMASIWEAAATRDVRLLQHALAHRSQLPQGCQWISYLRCHDDIGWGFADEDARRLGIDPAGHRGFLNAYYAGEFEGSDARGARFQDNPRTGDARISGTLASLAGLEAALETADTHAVDVAVRRILALHAVMVCSVGIPLIYLGDELGQLNDYGFVEDPRHREDNRWMHRPRFPLDSLLERSTDDLVTDSLLSGVSRLLEVRRRHQAFRSAVPEVLDAGSISILALRRSAAGEEVLVLTNLTDDVAEHSLDLDESWTDAFGSRPVSELTDPRMEPYEYRLMVRAQS